MFSKRDSRGSLWRQWDFHFHTPASYDYKDKSVTNQQIIDGLIAEKVSAIVISDHHRMDVERIKNLQALAGDRLTVFPGIELRSELGGSASVHYIGIFPEDSNIEMIWTKLQGKLTITPSDVSEKGDDFVYVPFNMGAICIHELGGLVSIHAGSKSNSIEEISSAQKFKQAIKTDMLRNLVNLLEVGKPKDTKAYIDIIFPAIGHKLPIVIGSDNHLIGKYERKAKCWIKADATFQGLCHLLHEPGDRVFIGETPPSISRVKNNRTKYIRSVSIEKVADSSLEEHWFDSEIPLNHGLVAIIGNKGSGKSALADIIGLLGDTLNGGSFSFLSTGRFCQAKSNKAQHFHGTIHWESDGIGQRKLNEVVDPGTVESVRYLPQSYIETICNELSSPESSRFAGELKSVIFSHVDVLDRLGHTSLDGLINYKTQETSEAISLRKNELQAIIEELVHLEESLTTRHRRNLEQQLASKERELKAHNDVRPVEVSKPKSDQSSEGEVSEVEIQIEEHLKAIQQLTETANALVDEKGRLNKKLAAADRLLSRIVNLQGIVQKFYSESETDCYELAIDIANIVQVKMDSSIIDNERILSAARLKEISESLSPNNPDSPFQQMREKQEEVENLRNKLDRPNQLYQQYLKDIAEWKERRLEIVGDEETPDTLLYCQKQVDDLLQLPERLKARWERALVKSLEIHQQIQRLSDEYRKLYEPVQHFIENHHLAKEHFQLSFQAAISESGFADAFLQHIHHSKRGSFCGVQDGREKALSLCKHAHFHTQDGVRAFLESVLHCLRHDTRDAECKAVELTDQLAKGVVREDVYHYLLGLSYLLPSYSLRWGGKDVEQLSPGERGTLLLVFYLLIDKTDIPLIIDQPEENLDNQTIYRDCSLITWDFYAAFRVRAVCNVCTV